MKKMLNYVMYPLMGFLIFNFFLKNIAQADGLKAYELMSAGKAVIIDVREKDEVKDGMIKGAQWIPLSDLKEKPEATVKHLKSILKDKELYAYCRSGNRSGKFLDQLKHLGIKGKNLGGYNDLVSKGLPTQIP